MQSVIFPAMNENVRPDKNIFKNVIVRNNWYKIFFAHVKKFKGTKKNYNLVQVLYLSTQTPYLVISTDDQQSFMVYWFMS